MHRQKFQKRFFVFLDYFFQMSEVNACPSCGADASHRKTDDEQPSLIFCGQCGYVLQESHFMDHHIFRHPDPRLRTQSIRSRSMEKVMQVFKTT